MHKSITVTNKKNYVRNRFQPVAEALESEMIMQVYGPFYHSDITTSQH